MQGTRVALANETDGNGQDLVLVLGRPILPHNIDSTSRGRHENDQKDNATGEWRIERWRLNQRMNATTNGCRLTEGTRKTNWSRRTGVRLLAKDRRHRYYSLVPTPIGILRACITDCAQTAVLLDQPQKKKIADRVWRGQQHRRCYQQ